MLLSEYLRHQAGISRARGPLFLPKSRRNHTEPLTLWTWSKVVRRVALAVAPADHDALAVQPGGQRAVGLVDGDLLDSAAVGHVGVVGVAPGVASPSLWAHGSTPTSTITTTPSAVAT